MADIEVSGPLVDPDFWDQFLLGIGVLVAGLGATLVAPFFLRRMSRPVPLLPEQPGRVAGEPQGAAKAGGASPTPLKAGRWKPPVHRAVEHWPQSTEKWTEKRKHVRRAGKPTPIHLRIGSGQDEPIDCEVRNRSRSGLCIALDRPFSVGTMIEVRPAESAAEAPWVKLEVRNCRKERDGWLIGCRFTAELPWSTILLFG